MANKDKIITSIGVCIGVCMGVYSLLNRKCKHEWECRRVFNERSIGKRYMSSTRPANFCSKCGVERGKL